MAAFDYTQGFYGYSKNHEEDEFERRQKLRKNYQTPAEQTFAELGEGRGKWNIAFSWSQPHWVLHRTEWNLTHMLLF